jgi:hypothetical protein
VERGGGGKERRGKNQNVDGVGGWSKRVVVGVSGFREEVGRSPLAMVWRTGGAGRRGALKKAGARVRVNR